MEIRSISEIGSELWNSFCLNSSSAWFQHTTFWMEYSRNMRFENDSIDHSFGVFKNNELVAIVPLIENKIIDEKDKRELSFLDWNTSYPSFSDSLSENNKKNIEKEIFNRILKMRDIDYINYFVSPLLDDNLHNIITTNPVTKFGFHDTTISTNILELGKDEETLFRKIRKGHKSDIKTAIKEGYKIDIINCEKVTADVFNQYRQIHFQAAGRQTRPDRTWEIMQEWIKNDLSILTLCKKDNVCISTVLINTYKQKAYYLSGATLPEYKREKGIGHQIQWEIIKHLNSQGFTHYELGHDWYPNISQEVADKKKLGISRFKAGFGGQKYPLFRGEYFHDMEFMRKVYSQRLNQYLALRK